MVMLYYRMIKEGLRTIEQVPIGIRPQVQALLDADEQPAGEGDV